MMQKLIEQFIKEARYYIGQSKLIIYSKADRRLLLDLAMDNLDYAETFLRRGARNDSG